MKIRLMKKEDIDKIVNIYKSYDVEDAKIIQNTYDNFYSRKKKDNYTKDYVLVERNEIIAFSGFNKETTETKDIFWINWTAVKPKYKNQGYGKLIVEYVLKEIQKRNGRKVYVSTSSEDKYEDAVRFYKRLDFKQEAILKDYYKDGVDSLIFAQRMS